MKPFLALALILSVSFLGACAVSTRYQKRGTEQELSIPIALDEFEASRSRQLDLEARSVERFSSPPFTLGIIELTDEGLVNQRQFEQVLASVRRDLDAAQKGSLLIVFAHGWHHSCRTCDRDLACFRRVLNRLNEDENSQGGRQRKVIGVYLGWRGRALLGKSDVLSIWNRKNKAEHIGRTGGREVLNVLHEEWFRRRDSARPVTMVSVGHSLGGALLFSAVRGKMSGNVDDIMNPGSERTYRTVRAEGERGAAEAGRKAIRSRFGDLVVLVNPAIEAEAYRPFDNDLKDVRYEGAADEVLRKEKLPEDIAAAYNENQLPAMLTIASTADTAVGVIFPISRWLSAVNFIRNGEVFIRPTERVGMGRYRPHFTHQLKYTGSPLPDFKEDESEAGCPCTKTWKSETFDFEKTQLNLQMEESGLRLPPQLGKAAAEASFDLDLVPIRANSGSPGYRGWDEHSPYLVISTDKSVIREHSDIFNPVFTGFLRKYLAAFERSLPKNRETAY